MIYNFLQTLIQAFETCLRTTETPDHPVNVDYIIVSLNV